MAKRLTDTEKWKDDWYISLDNDYRIIWQWLLDNCSHAGFCKRSMALLNIMCRTNISEKDLIEKMDGRVFIHGNDWFLPKFIKFQYPTLLSQKPVILSVVKELFEKNAIVMIPESFGNDYKIITKSFQNHCQMIKDKDKDKDKDKKGGVGENKNGTENWKHAEGKVVGVEFLDNVTKVKLSDGTIQVLGEKQKERIASGDYFPRNIYKGAIW